MKGIVCKFYTIDSEVEDMAVERKGVLPAFLLGFGLPCANC